MQILKQFILFTLLSLSTIAYSQISNHTSDSAKVIKGHVFDEVSGENFPLVLVTLFFSETDYKSVRCDFDGNFILHVPIDKKLTADSYLEFISYSYKPVFVKGNLDQIISITIELEPDPTEQISKETYEKLCKERYDYFNECGTKD